MPISEASILQCLTALHFTCRHGSNRDVLAALEQLRSAAAAEAAEAANMLVDETGASAATTQKPAPSLVAEALQVADAMGVTPLLHAVQRRLADVVSELLAAGAHPAYPRLEPSLNSALHVAALKHQQHQTLQQHHRHESSKRLASVDLLSANGSTPLLYACGTGHLGVSAVLLKAGTAYGNERERKLEPPSSKADATAIATAAAATVAGDDDVEALSSAVAVADANGTPQRGPQRPGQRVRGHTVIAGLNPLPVSPLPLQPAPKLQEIQEKEDDGDVGEAKEEEVLEEVATGGLLGVDAAASWEAEALTVMQVLWVPTTRAGELSAAQLEALEALHRGALAKIAEARLALAVGVEVARAEEERQRLREITALRDHR
ncbi:hypothetical protein VOLCADRAFT_91686 [Volvox carteri f. nagariensis]|uniref:Uncharacterized protein n=1 Tax=Volvox carteri f. nagariensis TaxID=3068 RepID=D8TXQ8_VOLCA|nr:uncharacterized protein VOLCADRAFT_91686 [Volvox carteri f. nagariensis]EFJ47682.1 hypothetical protein VOLCADRAFT_91686 [Volvox carteri f. nagariensis]|eukprot:XP_002951153.1 hypothetical protein VOLCADRAFT_91686 [Volvox carteri f. nagariensis]